MKKELAVNTFSDGLMLDQNPLVQPSSSLSNALNATFITMNGNEMILLNDMGNGRVETAYLPAGFVPLGICQLGGIIYIVSYNPLTDKCQIGSFPSPERNFASYEETDLKISLSNADFGYIGADNGSTVYKVTKALSDVKFNAGDSFVIIGDKIEVNLDKFYYKGEVTYSNTMTLTIAAITDTGEIIKFNPKSLKRYLNDFIIAEGTVKTSNDEKIDLDKYRSLVSSPYNIYTSKISGKLVLLAELLIFSDFDFTITDDPKNSALTTFVPLLTSNMSDSTKFIPQGVKYQIKVTDKDTKDLYNTKIESIYNIADGPQTNITLKESLDKETELLNIIKESIQKLLDRYMTITAIPCMNWGEITHLKYSYTLNLGKLYSGEKTLTIWRYYSDGINLTLNWGIAMYLKKNQSLEQVSLVAHPIDDLSQLINLPISWDGSQFGTYTDNIMYSTDGIVANNLYLVDLKVGNDIVDRRWLYTNGVFNSEFRKDTSDFSELTLPLKYFANSEITPLHEKNISTYTHLAKLKGEYDVDRQDYENYSILQKQNDYQFKISTTLSLEQTYNSTFYTDNNSLAESGITYSPEVSYDSIRFLEGDSYSTDYLSKFSTESIITDDLSKYICENTQDPSSIPELVIINPSLDNSTISFTGLLGSIIYADVTSEDYSFTSMCKPLAYDKETFAKYNLQYVSNMSYIYDWEHLSLYKKLTGIFYPIVIGTMDVADRTPHIPLRRMTYKKGIFTMDTTKQGDMSWVGGWTEPESLKHTADVWGDYELIFVIHYYPNDERGRVLSKKSNIASDVFSRNVYISDNNFNNGPYYTAQLFVKTADPDFEGGFAPINFGKFKVIGSNGVSDFCTANSSAANTFKQLFHCYAMILNNVYHVTGSKKSYNLIKVDQVYYVNEYKYFININYKVSLKSLANIYFKSPNGSYNLKALQLIAAKYTDNPLKNNVTAEMEMLSDFQVSKKLELNSFNVNKFVDTFSIPQLPTSGAVGITDYNGEKLLSWQSDLSSSVIYFRDGVEIKSNTTFDPAYLIYTPDENEITFDVRQATELDIEEPDAWILADSDKPIWLTNTLGYSINKPNSRAFIDYTNSLKWVLDLSNILKLEHFEIGDSKYFLNKRDDNGSSDVKKAKELSGYQRNTLI